MTGDRKSQSVYKKKGRDRILPAEALSDFVAWLMQTYPVMGPCRRPDQPGFYLFDWLKSAEDLVSQYTTTTLPPKKAFAPPDQTLFYFESGSPPKIKPYQEAFPFVLMGVHPCDLAALAALDIAYTNPPRERLWSENRKRAIIIGMDCMPDEYCFCTSVDTAHARKPCDLFLTNLGDEYLVEIYSEKGRGLVNENPMLAAEEKHHKALARQRRRKETAITAGFHTGVDELAHMLEKGGLTKVWKETAERCYSCGSCTTTCPACFCFNMHDALDPHLKNGWRHRTWDSCQLLEFALIAGGTNMRKERWQRVRHRWHRKFLYLYLRFGIPFCTGCGRCSRACTADINMVDITNHLIKTARGEETLAHTRI